MGFTRKAYAQEFVTRVDDSSPTFWDKVPNGSYMATGEDYRGKRIRRDYTVNSRIDSQGVWAMWNDFCGRRGLNKIWYLYWGEDNRQHRMLIWDEFGGV